MKARGNRVYFKRNRKVGDRVHMELRVEREADIGIREVNEGTEDLRRIWLQRVKAKAAPHTAERPQTGIHRMKGVGRHVLVKSDGRLK
jgi:hypothetical protein